METDPPPFFITGLPRSRTAWLSVVCSMAGAPCTHEGMDGFSDFDAYAVARPTRGDADPALLAFVPDILARWPEARLVLVARDNRAALASLLAALPLDQRRQAGIAWEGLSHCLSVARDRLRDDPRALLVSYESLNQTETLARVLRHVGGTVPAPAVMDSWQRLRVTSRFRPAPIMPRPALAPSAQVSAADVCDVAGLSADLYERSDFETAAEWWQAHNGSPLHESCLPPLGVRVSLDGVPVAFCWLYETFGVPVAELVFPVTRPGLSLGDARRALLFAVAVLVNVAGKGHEPEASFTTFKALAPHGLALGLKALGFREMLKDRKPMILTL